MPDPNKRALLSFAAQLTWRDCFMLLNMVFFLIIGTVMLYRAVSQQAPWLLHLMALTFLLAGGYRFYCLYKVLKGR